MNDGKQKRLIRKRRTSGALAVSIVMHVGFIILAISFVAVTSVIKPEQEFEARTVKRPRMNLRKLQVPVIVKRPAQQPKIRKTIVVKTRTPQVDIKMPEIIGVKGGLGSAGGGGLAGLGFALDLDLFGSGKSRGAGNEFIGHFYDLKQTPAGELTDIGKLAEESMYSGEASGLCMQEIYKFIRSGMKETQLKSYFEAPKLKYATMFNMPPMAAGEAPKAFGVDDQVKPSYWICVYRGQIAAPEDGTYRFVGLADDVLVVRLNRRLVLDASWPEHLGRITDWKSRDEESRKFPINRKDYGDIKGADWNEVFQKLFHGFINGEGFSGILGQIKTADGKPFAENGNYMRAANRLVMGDWVDLKKGQRVDMEVLIGEIPGGAFGCRLMVQQQDVIYPLVDSDAGQRPVLPAFKTVPVDEKLVSQMKADPNEISLDGPVFGVVKGAK